MTIGIDEVGRGAWAGPLVVGLVRFNACPEYAAQLNDSKLLSKSKREELEKIIVQTTDCSVGEVSGKEIDKLGLTKATKLAILRALASFSDIEEILIDGNVNYLKGTAFEHLTMTQIKADMSVYEVMAASIIAKVHRDALMQKLHRVAPHYGFDTNVGYGTKKHRQALIEHGISKHHRRSYRIKGL